MLVLHAGFHAGALLVWREPEAGKPALLAAVGELGDSLRFSKRSAVEAFAWVPTRAGRPVPSTPLLNGGEPILEETCRLDPMPITALRLSPAQAVAFLTSCIGKRMIAPGVLLGEDLIWWTHAVQFAGGLVNRGSFLPSINREDGRYAARWFPVFSGPDAGRQHALAKAMPAAARAVTLIAGSPAPDTPAETVVTEFAAAIVDELVRSSAAAIEHPSADSVHDRWMRALTSSDALVDASAAESASLASQVNDWQRALQVSARAPFRLCFRLEEPPPDSDSWKIGYFLQGTKDPSLFLPAADVWKGRKSTLPALGQDGAAVREHLLVSLGQAAGICPLVHASLKSPAPEGYSIDVSGAYEFLRQTAGALEQSGFGVRLPAWWTRTGTETRLKARARVKSKSLAAAAILSLDTIVQFDWELALGGEKISKAELAALARLKTPLVKLRGQWVEVNAADIQAALEFLKKNGSPASSVRDLVRMELGAAPAGPLEIEGVEATGWIKDIFDRLQGRVAFEEKRQPAELQGELRPYQRRGYSWLDFLKEVGLGACLADDMGLGKTIQTLALLQHDWSHGERRPVLLVCPTSVTGNWQKEAARFTPDLPVLVHHGIARSRGSAFEQAASRHALIVSTYTLLHRDLDVLRQVNWAGVILDEAQNIKNPETMQARAARSLTSGYRIALTGTPVENNVGDLWSVMEFLNPGFLGSQSAFRTRFFAPIQLYGDKKASERLRKITAPFILRRLKTDKSIIADLPDKLEMKVFCSLTKEQASLYEAVAKEAQKAIEESAGIERKGLVLATLLKLKQVCNHPAQFLKDRSSIAGRSGKLARITEMLEETLQVGDRSLIFTQFTEMGDMLQRHLQENFGLEIMYLHGATTKKQRDRMVERFASPDGPRIFLLSLKAGGTGLNLVSANHVFHFDRWWNPAVENQATDRAFRIGQKKNVQVHKFVCAGTLEERIDEMIERKKEVAGGVIGAGEAWLSELSNSELRDLFELRKDAVGD